MGPLFSHQIMASIQKWSPEGARSLTVSAGLPSKTTMISYVKSIGTGSRLEKKKRNPVYISYDVGPTLK